nr:hypothetical protein GCM10020185_45090 [Pseudomonas brassicacearum subsp. brassicacearum]
MNPFQYSKPDTVQAAVDLSSPVSRFIAGGTNLLDLMKENLTRPEHLIDITGLPLADLSETPSGGGDDRGIGEQCRPGLAPVDRAPLSAAGPGHPGGRLTATAQHGQYRRQPAATHTLLLLL